jgi:heme a synthase
MKSIEIKAYKILCYAIFFLVVLGGAVRAMNAGLACPDWPLCFGDVIPDFHPQVYFEFTHRVVAGVIGIASIYLNIKILRASEVSYVLKCLAGFAIVLLLMQVVVGGLTVLLQLHNKIVALHLTMGTGFFALSFWIYLTLKFKIHFLGTEASRQALRPAVILFGAVYGQIILGGLVASNYAALACRDFPLCNGEFIPTLRGNVGIQVIHRLGAYSLAIIVASFAYYIMKRNRCREIRKWTMGAYIVLVAQICIGVANVKFLTPPLLTVLHLAVGTILLAVAIRILRTASYQKI